MQALQIGDNFIDNQLPELVMGDYICHCHDIHYLTPNAMAFNNVGSLLAYHVHDQEHFGLVEINCHGNVLSLKEKLKQSLSNSAITEPYFTKAR